jgi:glutathione S-transferase
MKLYFSPGACSLSPHIALREAGLAFDLVRVDLRAKQLKEGGDFLAINEKGFVPVLELDNGERLTEGPAIVQYIADLAPESGLAPKAGTMERVRMWEWLNYITAELHKGHTPLFNPKAPDAWKELVKEALHKNLAFTSRKLEGKEFAMGDRFTVVDGYLYTVLRWPKLVGVDLSPYPVLTAYSERIEARPAVHEALLAERLLKPSA